MQSYRIDLTGPMLEIIGRALGELPYKLVAPVIAEIDKQLEPQRQPQPPAGNGAQQQSEQPHGNGNGH